MAAFTHSLVITDRYRDRMRLLRDRAVLSAANAWRRQIDPNALDRSHAAWVTATAAALTEFQRVGVRLSAGYLSAFLSSELVTHVGPEFAEDTSGRARDGKPIAEALVPSLFTVKAAIGEGRDVTAAMGLGLDRAARLIADESVAPARDALSAGIVGEGRVLGWRRVSGGGCGACLAAATGAIQEDDEVLEVHPYCECSKEPVVADVPDRVQRPTGTEMFSGMSSERQDALLGADKAELIRSGDVPLHELIQRDPMAAVPDGITERPLADLQQH